MAQPKLHLKGVYTALVTPFSRDGSEVDFDSLGRLLDEQKKAGIDGVVVCGSTGEAATLTDTEYVEVVRFVRKRTAGVCPCVAGISVSATAKAIELAKVGQELGCDGLLVATPPYNKPSQVGIAAHYKAIHAAVSLPIIGYNIPGRSGVAIAPSTLGALSREGVIIGIKESSGSVDALADTMTAVDPSCQVVSGDDSLTLAVLAYGGVGVISASANVLPREFAAITRAWFEGKPETARAAQLDILAKIRALFIESNPVPAKTVLAAKGVISHATVRLPLAPLAETNREKLLAEF